MYYRTKTRFRTLNSRSEREKEDLRVARGGGLISSDIGLYTSKHVQKAGASGRHEYEHNENVPKTADTPER